MQTWSTLVVCAIAAAAEKIPDSTAIRSSVRLEREVVELAPPSARGLEVKALPPLQAAAGKSTDVARRLAMENQLSSPPPPALPSPPLAPGTRLVRSGTELEHALLEPNAAVIVLAVSGSPYQLGRPMQFARSVTLQAEVEGEVQVDGQHQHQLLAISAAASVTSMAVRPAPVTDVVLPETNVVVPET